MDDLAHEFSLNHRKRKARQDDQNDDKPKHTRQNCDKDSSARPAKAPRLSWLSPDSGPALWNSPSSPQVSTPVASPSTLATTFPLRSSKLVRESIPPRHPLHEQSSLPASPTSISFSDSVTGQIDNELGEGTSHSERERVLLQTPQLSLDISDEALSIPITMLDLTGLASLYTPPVVPLINRQTLKDLDFNEIMHNTPLREFSY